MKFAGAIFLTARVDAVYIDKGLLGPRLPEAGPLAEPFLEHKLASYLAEALRAPDQGDRKLQRSCAKRLRRGNR